MSDPGKDEKVQHVSDSTFEQDVVGASEAVLVDFWAPWCGPCKRVGPFLEELAQKLEGKLKVAKMNVDENPSVPAQLGVRSIPTLVVWNCRLPTICMPELLMRSSLANLLEPKIIENFYDLSRT